MKSTLLLAALALSTHSSAQTPFLQGMTGDGPFWVWYGPGGFAGNPYLYKGDTFHVEVWAGNRSIAGGLISITTSIPAGLTVNGGGALLTPVTLRADQDGLPIPGFPEFTGIYDPRNATQKAAAPKFSEIIIRSKPGIGPGLDGVVSGRITNAGGDPTLARIEFYNGVGWISLINPGSGVQPDGRFRGFFRSATNPPLIRVVLPGMPDSYGYSTSSTPSSTNYPALRPSLTTPTGPRSRFNTRSKAGANGGIRG